MSTQLAPKTASKRYCQPDVHELRVLRAGDAATVSPRRGHGVVTEDFSSLAHRLSPAEWRRRLLHFAPGILPFLSLAIPHDDPIDLDYRIIALTIVAVLFAWAWRYFERARRPGEPDKRAAILGYTIPPLLLFLLFPAHVELALAALAIIAFGDGTATLVGKLFGRRRLPWNPKKTWAGTIAFVLVAVPLASIIYWGEANPRIPLTTAFLCAGAPAIITATVESVLANGNDNFYVATSAAVSLVLMQALFVGITW